MPCDVRLTELDLTADTPIRRSAHVPEKRVPRVEESALRRGPPVHEPPPRRPGLSGGRTGGGPGRLLRRSGWLLPCGRTYLARTELRGALLRGRRAREHAPRGRCAPVAHARGPDRDRPAPAHAGGQAVQRAELDSAGHRPRTNRASPRAPTRRVRDADRGPLVDGARARLGARAALGPAPVA